MINECNGARPVIHPLEVNLIFSSSADAQEVSGANELLCRLLSERSKISISLSWATDLTLI